MRNLFSLLLVLWVGLVSAQTIVYDSTAVIYILGEPFTERHLLYDNGRKLVETSPADTSVIADQQTAIVRNTSTSMSIDARAVSVFPDRIKEWLRQRDAMFEATGKDFLKPFQDELAPSLTTPGWTIKVDTTTYGITFNVNAQGVLRYTVQGSAANTAFVVGPNIIRLRRFRGSRTDVDLYFDNKRWWDMNHAIVMRSLNN